MKSTILIMLFIVLLPLSVTGQNDIEAALSYNKSNSTLTVEIKNISDQAIIIPNQSRYAPTSGSSFELGFKDKDGKKGYNLVPLANESTNYLWDDFTEIKPLETRKCVYNESIKFFGGDRTLFQVDIFITYSFVESSGKRIHSRYKDTLIIK